MAAGFSGASCPRRRTPTCSRRTILAAKSLVVAIGISHFSHIHGGWPICPESWYRTPRTIGTLAHSPAAISWSSVADSRRSRLPRWPVSKAPTSGPRASPGWSGTAYPTKSLIGRRSGYAVRRLVSATAAVLRQFARGVPSAAGADAGPRGEDGARPAGPWCLKERVLGWLPVLTGHTVFGAEADGNHLRLRVQRDDGRLIDQTTEHLISGTGYCAELGRLPSLGDQLRGRLRLVAGRPRCRPASKRRPRTCISSG
jgi:hypothetical protein